MKKKDFDDEAASVIQENDITQSVETNMRDSQYNIGDFDEHVTEEEVTDQTVGTILDDSTTEVPSNGKVVPARLPRNQLPQMEGNRRERFFESFFVVGISEDELYDIEYPESVMKFEPQNLHTHPNNEANKERAEVVKDFCFPTGVEVRELDLSDPAN